MRHLSMPWSLIDEICQNFPCCQHWLCSIVGSSVKFWLSRPWLFGLGSLIPSFYAYQLGPTWAWEAWVRHPSKCGAVPTLLYELKWRVLGKEFTTLSILVSFEQFVIMIISVMQRILMFIRVMQSSKLELEYVMPQCHSNSTTVVYSYLSQRKQFLINWVRL